MQFRAAFCRSLEIWALLLGSKAGLGGGAGSGQLEALELVSQGGRATVSNPMTAILTRIWSADAYTVYKTEKVG